MNQQSSESLIGCLLDLTTQYWEINIKLVSSNSFHPSNSKNIYNNDRTSSIISRFVVTPPQPPPPPHHHKKKMSFGDTQTVGQTDRQTVRRPYRRRQYKQPSVYAFRRGRQSNNNRESLISGEWSHLSPRTGSGRMLQSAPEPAGSAAVASLAPAAASRLLLLLPSAIIC